MAVRQYIGARYVAKIYVNSLDPSSMDWESGVAYEPLTMVSYNSSSYISRKAVTASVGNPADNPEYWAVTGLYNGQIAQLQNDVNALETQNGSAILTTTAQTLSGAINELNTARGVLLQTASADGVKTFGDLATELYATFSALTSAEKLHCVILYGSSSGDVAILNNELVGQFSNYRTDGSGIISNTFVLAGAGALYTYTGGTVLDQSSTVANYDLKLVILS